MNKCKECGSYAINPGRRGRDDSDLDLCDVCYWRVRAERLQAVVDADNKRMAWICDADGAVYFVLRLDDNGDDDTHLIACREAARAYCRVIHRLPAWCHLRPVADDLWTLVNEIEAAVP